MKLSRLHFVLAGFTFFFLFIRSDPLKVKLNAKYFSHTIEKILEKQK